MWMTACRTVLSSLTTLVPIISLECGQGMANLADPCVLRLGVIVTTVRVVLVRKNGIDVTQSWIHHSNRCQHHIEIVNTIDVLLVIMRVMALNAGNTVRRETGATVGMKIYRGKRILPWQQLKQGHFH
jgi:hypothetical protein